LEDGHLFWPGASYRPKPDAILGPFVMAIWPGSNSWAKGYPEKPAKEGGETDGAEIPHGRLPRGLQNTPASGTSVFARRPRELFRGTEPHLNMKPWIQLIAKLQEWFAKVGRRRHGAASPVTMLRCRDAVDLILAYLECTLDPCERRAFEAHIADCQNCWRFLKTYRETVSLGQQLQEEAIPPDVRERLETFLRSRLTPTS
jgi:hypothetical protein